MKTINEIQDDELALNEQTDSKVKILDVCCGSRMFWFDKKRATHDIHGYKERTV